MNEERILRHAALLLSAALASCAAPRDRSDPSALGHTADALMDPTWTPASAMSAAREGHTATRLPDGRVLVAGGIGNQQYKTVEIYDPVSTSFTWAPSMTSTRVNHFAVLLGSGEVLVAGGDGDGPATAEIYDPATAAWAPAGMLSQDRTRAAGALLPDGKVLLSGGYGAGVDLYDPTTNAWTAAAAMGTPRSAHSATVLPSGKVLVAGGITQQKGKDVTTSSAEIYDPAADAWAPAASLLVARAQHTATALADGRVLVAGGTSQPGPDSLTELAAAEIYDPVLDAWQGAGAMLTPRVLHTATRLGNGAVLVTGGVDLSDSALPTAELFDTAGVAAPWSQLAPMARTRILHTATLLADGTVLVAGGEQQSSAELFHLGDLGEPCAVDQQCASGHCADHVCCDTACAEACHACGSAASPGTCAQAAAGTDPRGVCGGGGACDPACGPNGACASRVGTPCTAGGCTGDRAGQLAPAVCAAGESACPIQIVPCAAEYRCDEAAGACRTECRSLADCAAGYACDPSRRCVRQPDIANGSAPTCGHALLPSGAARTAFGAAALLALAAMRRRSRVGRKT